MKRENKILAFALGMLLTAMASFAPTASASNHGLEKLYKVQVEYWFFDTDYFKWETYYESTSATSASFVYALLKSAKDSGDLQNVAPNDYWRFMPVDVRLITTYRLKPQITASQTRSRYAIGR